MIMSTAAPQSAWTAESFDYARARVRFSEQAQSEWRNYLASEAGVAKIEEASVDARLLPRVSAELDALRPEVERGSRLVFLQPVDGLSAREVQLQIWVVGCLLGEPLVQNLAGDRLIHVWDRDPGKRMRDGARYHQTHDDGDVHTDNVNLLEHWDYLVLGCVAAADIGGISVIVNGLTLYRHLLANAAEAVDVLKRDFWWECRGFHDDELYRAPVLSLDVSGEPHFRHLRTYLESAHAKAREPLTARQVWALNVLDAALGLPELRLYYDLRPGEIMLAKDSQILHARTRFADPPDAISIDEWHAGGEGRLRRTLERGWIRKSS